MIKSYKILRKVGYIGSKRQKHIFKRRFSKTGNAVSESEKTTIQKLQDLKDSKIKNNPINHRK